MVVVVHWFINVLVTCKCISETDVLGQFYVLTLSEVVDETSVSPNHSILTAGKPVPVLTL